MDLEKQLEVEQVALQSLYDTINQMNENADRANEAVILLRGRISILEEQIKVNDFWEQSIDTYEEDIKAEFDNKHEGDSETDLNDDILF